MESTQNLVFEVTKNSSLAGIATGILHHSILQYPKQAKLFTILKAFFFVDALFLVLKVGSLTEFSISTLGEVVLDLTLFNTLYITTAFLLKTTYNVYFRHPDIPARFLWAASDWRFWYANQYQKPYKEIEAMHRELGDVIRVQPNHIVFRNINAIEDIYGQNTKSNKGEIYQTLFKAKNYPPSLIAETDKRRHAFLRRVVNPSFGPTSLKAFEPILNRYFHEFITGIEKRAASNKGVVELNEWFHNLAFDIAGSLGLGTDFGSLQSGEPHFFIEALQAGFKFASFFAGISWLMPLIHVLPTPKSVTETRDRCRNFSRKAVQDTLERDNSEEEKNILGSLKRAVDKDTGAKLGFPELVINANLMLIAGGDTVAVSLTFALHYIVSFPKVWNRLCREIRERFQSDEEITGQATAQMAYLDAVVHEALRIRPIVSGNQIRVTPPEGMTIGGRYVRGNTEVSCPNWALLHDERYFSNPYSFIPERWIEAERGNETCNKKAFIPFSYGKWDCVGKPLALLEMRVSLAKLIWNFDISLKDPDQAEPSYDHNALAAGELPLRLVKVIRT